MPYFLFITVLGYFYCDRNDRAALSMAHDPLMIFGPAGKLYLDTEMDAIVPVGINSC